MEKLTTAQSVRDYLRGVIRESLESMHKNALEEKDAQDAQVSASELFASDDDTDKKSAPAPEPAEKQANSTQPAQSTEPVEEPKAKEPPAASKTSDADKQALETGEVTPDTVIDVLNGIRAGKSFSRDETVKTNLSQYVESLSTAEKTSLLAFLKGIAQIVTGTVSGEEAVDPGKDPANVEMEKKVGGEEQQPAQANTQKHVKPNVTSKAQPKKLGAEDTSAPKMQSPITPKTR